MSIYKRDEVDPEWEPIPWDASGPQVDEQEKGLHERALKPLVWKTVEPRRVCRRPFSLREWTYDREEAETSLLA